MTNMTAEEIVAFLEKNASNASLVAERKEDRLFTHQEYWNLLRLHILDMVGYIKAN